VAVLLHDSLPATDCTYLHISNMMMSKFIQHHINVPMYAKDRPSVKQTSFHLLNKTSEVEAMHFVERLTDGSK